MLSNLNYLLVSTTCLVSICTAIRVDWNTNTGPIIPPTPRTTVRPQPPFREPAPVWEDLSNDIPNPNPYIYVPPPPSRPKSRLNTNVNYNLSGNRNNYGALVTPQNANNYFQQNNNSPQVASLSPQYIPNVGTKYVAVVPKISNIKSASAASNSLSPDDKTAYKTQGKYNVKTKKYKAYEKVKYVPVNYSSLNKTSSINAKASVAAAPKEEQQLPAKEKAQPWSAIFNAKESTPAPTKSYTKHLYAKDVKLSATKLNNNANVVNNIKKS